MIKGTILITTLLKPLQWYKSIVFFIVLIGGLFYVKWSPYYKKVFFAAENHNIGNSVLLQIDNTPLLAAIDYAKIYFLSVWQAALLGLILGSLVQVLIPRNWLLKTLGKTNVSSVFWGTFFALPAMMCSCCAAPLVAGMRRHKISIGGALAFWIGNPLLNPATLIFMGFVLGWSFTIIRLIAGIATIFIVALCVQNFIKDTHPIINNIKQQADINNTEPFLKRWIKTFCSLFWNTIPIYIIAVLALGALSVWFFPHSDSIAGNSFWLIVAMAIVGCLFVIPTAAEIPIISALMLAGLGLAPATALLITLPAISLPSLFMLRKAFPTKALWLTAILVILCGIATGLSTYIL